MFNETGQGAVFAEMAQANITEFVDATLTGRPYNYKRKFEAGTASVAKNMGSIMSDGREVKRQIEEMEFEDTAEFEPEPLSFDDNIIG